MAGTVSVVSQFWPGRASSRAIEAKRHLRLRRLARTLAPLTSVLLFLPVLLAFLALPSTVFAHRVDEYLQATLVVIEPETIRLQINLTPGVAVAEQVLALIDRDRDGVISTNEAAAYSELLKRDLIVRLDQRNLELKPTASFFPGIAELQTGWGFIQMEFSAPPGRLAAGTHNLTIEGRHLPSVSVYLINAAQPASPFIQILKQIRNENQSVGEIRFTYQPPPNSFKALGLVAFLLILVVSVSAGAQRVRTFTNSLLH